jgi:hypothetical protein
MIAKYHIEYGVPFHHGVQKNDYLTDDPVTVGQFLADLLEREYRVLEIKHEGVRLPQKDTDKLLKSAASLMVNRHLSAALGIRSEEVHHRFGSIA